MMWLATALAVTGCTVRLYAIFQPSRAGVCGEIARVLFGMSGVLVASSALRSPPVRGRLPGMSWRVVGVLPAVAIAIAYALGRTHGGLDVAVATFVAACVALLPWGLGIGRDLNADSATTGARLLLGGCALLVAESVLRVLAPGSLPLVWLIAPLVTLAVPGLALAIGLLPGEALTGWLLWAPALAISSQLTGLVWLHFLGVKATPALLLANGLLITFAGVLLASRGPAGGAAARTAVSGALVVLALGSLIGFAVWPSLEPTPPTPPSLGSGRTARYPLPAELGSPRWAEEQALDERRSGDSSVRIDRLTMVREPMGIESMSLTVRNTTASPQRGSAFYVVGDVGEPQPWRNATFTSPRVPFDLTPGHSRTLSFPGTPALGERAYSLSVWVHVSDAGSQGERHSDGVAWSRPLEIFSWASLEMETEPGPLPGDVFVRFRATNRRPQVAELDIAYSVADGAGATGQLLSRGSSSSGGEQIASLRMSPSGPIRMLGYVTTGGPAPRILAVRTLDLAPSGQTPAFVLGSATDRSKAQTETDLR